MASTARTGSPAAAGPPFLAGPASLTGTASPAEPAWGTGTTEPPPSPSAAGRWGPSGAVFSASPGCAAGDEASSSLLPPTMPVWWALLWPGREIRPGRGPRATMARPGNPAGSGTPRDPRNEPTHGNRRAPGLYGYAPAKESELTNHW